VKEERLLEMLNFYSDTFTRLLFSEFGDVAETSVTMISSILNYDLAVLYTPDDGWIPPMIASKGLDRRALGCWREDKGIPTFLLGTIHSARIIDPGLWETDVAAAAARFGLEEKFLIAPLWGKREHKIQRLGLVLAGRPVVPTGMSADLVCLDLLANLIMGAMVNCLHLGSIRDMVCELNQRARELQASHDNLKSTQGQLVEAAKLAAVGELAAGVAHEINSPLSALLGYAGIMKEKFEEAPEFVRSHLPEFPQQLDTIKEAALRCSSFSKDLLTFSRRAGGEVTELELSELVDKTIHLLRGQLRHRRVKVTTEIEEDMPPLRGNANQLQQVLTSLLLNAGQAMSSGGEVLVRVICVDEDCQISIADTGPGIPQENLTRIFEPFFSTRPDGLGAGLGLSIARGIIHNHGGKLAVDSMPGQGSTFTIKLPLKHRGETSVSARASELPS